MLVMVRVRKKQSYRCPFLTVKKKPITPNLLMRQKYKNIFKKEMGKSF